MLPRPSQRAALGLALLLLVPASWMLAPADRRPGAAPRPAPRDGLHLAWVRQEPPLAPAWPDQVRFASDGARRPVVAGDVVLLSSSRHDSVSAVDRLSGARLWAPRADGPVRFAPAVWRDRAFFASDDGHLYCVRLSDGKRLWRFRGGPSDRLVLGNERLISTWPARGAPAVAAEDDGGATVYFAAGIWPFMGVFLHALDARTGEVRWTNSGDGSTYIKQPHHADAFAGLAPQGQIVVAGDRLLVPGGRSIPACYDRRTGARLHYRLADSSKMGGGPDLAVGDGVYHSGGGIFATADGKYLGPIAEPAAFVGKTLYSAAVGRLRAFDLAAPPAKKKDKFTGEAWLGEPAASATVGKASLLTAADGRLYGAAPGGIFAIKLPLSPTGVQPAWRAAVDGTPVHLVADGGMVLVSTREGRVYAFAPGAEGPSRGHGARPQPLPAGEGADAVVKASGVREGYAVVWGAGDLVPDLLRKTSLRLMVFDTDARRVARLREELEAADVGGDRASVRRAEPDATRLPPYLASLAVYQGDAAERVASGPEALDVAFAALRPHGGTMLLPNAFATEVRRWRDGRSSDPEAVIETKGEYVVVRRPGAPPGAADWTHQHADAANTRVSRGRLVKAPLGVLWFGGPGHQGILPRHGHGPVPQVCEGRLVIEGPDRLRAVDIYTGRLLWEAILPGLGKVYDNQSHQPGANAAGSNYVSTPEGIYVAHGDGCLRLDPATGKTLAHFRLPGPGKTGPKWTYLSVVGDCLIAGSGEVLTAAKGSKKKTAHIGASRQLTVLDRRTGSVRFTVEARSGGFRHNGVCAGNGLLFALDRPVDPPGNDPTKGPPGRIVAYDLATGKRLWKHDKDAFGTWLSYSAARNVLVEAGLMARDTLADEAPGMRTFAGRTGRVLWHRPDYFGPALVHGDRLLKGGDARAGSGTACDLRSGEPIESVDPLTGSAIPWRWERTYGCNTPAASEHLVLFRSGAAGFYDLCNDGGTGNLGGFRSSCTMNLIAAGGVLTCPDYTRSCTCSYQQQTSIALVHTPDAEMWTFTTSRSLKGVVRQAGVNLGAPGGRKADNGTLWLEHPPSGGPSPKLGVKTSPSAPATFRMHSSQVAGDRGWVGASGMRGLRELTLPLGAGTKRRYTVRLVFLEPEAEAGRRVFDVALQGAVVAPRLDVAAEAGGPRRVLVREFRGVAVERDLVVRLTPASDAEVPEAVLSGVEVLPEGW